MGSGPGDIQQKNGDNAKPNMKHGVHAVQSDPHGTLAWLEDNDPDGYDWVRSKWLSYLDDAPFDQQSAKSDDVLHACLMLYAVRGVRDRQISRGLSQMVEMRTEQGAVFEVEEELPVNLPANRLAREARSMLKDLGLLDDPESKKADAMGWGSAAKEVAMEVDATVEDAADADDADGGADGAGR